MREVYVQRRPIPPMVEVASIFRGIHTLQVERIGDTGRQHCEGPNVRRGVSIFVDCDARWMHRCVDVIRPLLFHSGSDIVSCGRLFNAMSMLVFLTLSCLLAAQTEAAPPDVQPLESVMSQPAEAENGQPAGESGQIEDAAKLILGDNTVEARQIGVRTLLRMGTPAAHNRLALILTHPEQGNGAARSAICGVLASSDAPPEALLEPLVSLVGELKGSALEGVRLALAAYPQAAAQRALCAIARDASAPTKRRLSMIEMIGGLGEDYAAAGVLANLLSDSDPAIRQGAMTAFTRMTGVEFDDADAAEAWWRERAGLGELKWLVRSNQRRREELRALRADRIALIERLVSAYRAAFLAIPEKDQGSRLVAFLQDDVSQVRELGLKLIAAMVIDQKEVPAEVREAVLPLLTDADPDIRRRAATIAGNLRIVGAIDVMIDRLKSERNARARIEFASAIGRLDDNRAIEPLVACLSSKDRDLVAEATLSLGSLARRGHADAEKTAFVATSLENRYGELADDDTELREKFLRAMARIGVDSFRTIFEREALHGQSAGVRTAAIAGLASYESGGTAEFMMGLLGEEDPLVRGSAIQALGRCGRTIGHFEALFERSSAGKEADSTVRDKAWDATQALFSRLSGSARLDVLLATEDREDAAIHRQRAVLARALKADRDASTELTPSKRLQVALSLAEALLRSGDVSGALLEWQDVAQQRGSLSQDLAQRVDLGLVRAGMRAGQNDAVFGALTTALAGMSGDERAARADVLRKCFETELASRTAAAPSPEAIASIYALIGPAASALATGDEISSTRDAWRIRVDSRRDVLIDALLDEQTGETTIADKLQLFDKQAVINRIHARLASIKATTSGPALDREVALIALARQLAPEWPGYTPGIPVEERARALEKLIAG